MPLWIESAAQYSNHPAIRSGHHTYTYDELIKSSKKMAGVLLADQPDLMEARVAFMVDPGFDYVRVQWAIWLAGGIAVPICISYPIPSIQYVLEDSQATIVVAGKEHEKIVSELKKLVPFRLIILGLDEDPEPVSSSLPFLAPHRKAMILYTSGTTNQPKGVVTTHDVIAHQIYTLVDAWKWTSKDHILCVLPLHHIHGIINVVGCALWSGAVVEFIPFFDVKLVMDLFDQGQINLFMAVPTIYFKLIQYYESVPLEKQLKITETLSRFRLMVSGSAALPTTVFEKWKTISQHQLLERYGMTEIGMGISNPYDGVRKPGTIGMPLPGVSVRLVDEDGQILQEHIPGEIQIKGNTVFKEYWNKPEATKKSFSSDGWFKTGDIAIIENGYYRILGRDSVDIIKSGGYKISALEIEELLRTYPGIKDCSVLGIPDEEWGERIAAMIIFEREEIDFEHIKTWLKSKIPAYKIPRWYTSLPELPRNVMGKVVKKELLQYFK